MFALLKVNLYLPYTYTRGGNPGQNDENHAHIITHSGDYFLGSLIKSLSAFNFERWRISRSSTISALLAHEVSGINMK